MLIQSKDPNVVYLKLSDARRIWRVHRGTLPQIQELDEYEGYFTACLPRPYSQVVVLMDENPDVETRPLLIEDCVEQSVKRHKVQDSLLAMICDGDSSVAPKIQAVRTKEGCVEFSITAFLKGTNEIGTASAQVSWATARSFVTALHNAMNQPPVPAQRISHSNPDGT